MTKLHTISISTALLFQFTGAHATNLDENFQRCTTAALEKRGQAATAISVITNGIESRDLDHNASPGKIEYRMQVTNKDSGENMGIVICSFGRSGDLLASAFDS